MKHRSVVANYIFKNEQDPDSLVALFRRSHHPNIHTCKGKLSPISGSIDAEDADSLAAAARELEEETQLIAHRDLKLQFCGKPFTFVDEAAQRSWTVNPFSWTLKTGEENIKLDWEHDGWEWVHARDILSRKITGNCVPRLDSSFRRVYFGPGGIFGDLSTLTAGNLAGNAFLAGLARLRTDKENGARVLATDAVNCLARIAKELESFDWKTFRIAAYHLIYSGRPSMNAAVSTAVLTALRRIIPLAARTASQYEVVNALQMVCTEREKASKEIANHFLTYLHEKAAAGTPVSLLTISSSSTIKASILNLLQCWPDLQINVTILESRPLCEGASMAADIRRLARDLPGSDRMRIHVVPDFHIARAVQQMEHPSFLLLGADRISPSGHVSNKMGSYVAAIVVKYLSPRTTVIVLSETDKVAKPSNLPVYEKREEQVDREMKEHSPESSDVTEVTRVWAAAGIAKDVVEDMTGPPDDFVSVELHNVSFEWIHRDLIDEYISEESPLTRNRIREISLEKARLENEMFEDLYDD